MAPDRSNLLLESLPSDYRASLVARMEPVDLPIETVLYKAGEPPEYAHFITSGIASVVAMMADGTGAEVGLLGRESFVESLHLLGASRVQTTCFIQVHATALRMPFADLKKEFMANESLHHLVLESVQVQGLILSQIAACNRFHEVEERLARWLLMVQDRVGSESFFLTQEFLAEMLGARRTTVTLAAGSLQRSGLVEYRRGNIRILDRQALIDSACECYPIVSDLASNLYQTEESEKQLRGLASD